MNKSNWSLIFERPKRGEKKRKREKKKKKKRRREDKKREEEAKPKRYETMTINMNTCCGLYGTTLD